MMPSLADRSCARPAIVPIVVALIMSSQLRGQCDPALVGSADTPASAQGSAIAGTVAYVADQASGLQVVDVSDLANPVIVGFVDTPDAASAVAVSGQVAYVADQSSGLQVIDVSNPASPAILGFVDTPGFARSVALDGTEAYVADGVPGLQVIDVSDPSNPAILGSINTPGVANDVAISGNLAYVADEVFGLQVIDVMDPGSPAIIGSVNTPGIAFAVAVSGNVAYVADANSGLQVIDVSNPTAPAILGSVVTPNTAEDVAVSGPRAYVTGQSELQVIDVSNGAAPAILGSFTTPSVAGGVTVSGTVAYVADQLFGLQIICASSCAPSVRCGPGAGPCNLDNGTPGCDDVECCALICCFDPSCCDVAWDAACAGEAINQGCTPVPGCVEGDEILEDEPCGVQQSGGCNSTPTQFVIAECGESYSGGVSAEAGEVDEDWFQVDLPAGGDLMAELRSEFDGMISIVEGVGEAGLPCPGPVVVGVEGSSFECIPGVAIATDLPPGLYCIVVVPVQKDGLPCRSPGTGYVMTPLPIPPVASPPGDECVPANRGACCLPTGNCMVMLPADCATQAGTFEGLLSNCSIPPCQACCLADGGCVYTADSTFCTNMGGTLQGESMAGGGSAVNACCFDDGRCCRRLTQTLCEAEGGTFQDFNNCESCPPIDVCPWDLNDNGSVDVLDLVALINVWGACPGGCPADFDGNENVGVLDLVAIIQAWGECPPDITCNG